MLKMFLSDLKVKVKLGKPVAAHADSGRKADRNENCK